MTTYHDQLFHDIFTTALEGGINYWAECSEYHWHNGDGYDDEDYEGFFAVIHDCEDDDKTYTVNRAVISKGYALAAGEAGNKYCWSVSRPPLVPTEDNEWEDFDASDADIIVQLGLFGEVIYG